VVDVAVVGVVLHSQRAEAAILARDLIVELGTESHDVRLPAGDAALIGVAELADPAFGAGLDVAVSLGGDGTMLRTVELVAPHGVPVIGVNVGHLGYLTEVEPVVLHDALDRFFAGDYDIEERMLLAVTITRPAGYSDDGTVEADERDAAVTSVLALNEAVVEKTLSGHTVRVDVTIDDAHFTPYAADGLIVATPTGSTAYALSARGPIIAPTHRALLLTPVSPHMLFDRSLILDPGTTVELTVMDRPGALIVDGRFLGELSPGDRISCTSARVDARLVTFRPRNFHQILKTKFGLNDR
jgi:NAD+ kinase